MSTKRKGSTATKYQRYEYKQLSTIIRNWHKKYTTLAKTPAWKTTQGWTPAEQRAAFKREIAIAVLVLRAKVLKAIDYRIQELKSEVAKSCGVSVSSPKCTSAAISQLTAKRRQVSTCSTVPALVTLCAAFRATSYKNPRSIYSYFGYTTTTAKKSKKVKKATRSTSKVSSTVVATKYKKQTKTLKKEIQKLKQRNSFMKSQVAKFRKEAAQLQRHYGTFNNQAPTKLRVITSKQVNKDVSNIVRFSNALNNAVQRQRKAS